MKRLTLAEYRYLPRHKISMKQSWTLSFARQCWPSMSLRSVFAFRDYKLRAEKGDLIKGNKIKLRMRSPIRGEIILRETGRNTTVLSRRARHQAAWLSVIRSPGMPLKQIMTAVGFERIDLLKVDVEGAEVELFKGDLEWLRSVKCIAIEFHEDSRKVIGFDEIMAHYGFRIVDTNPHTVVAVSTG